MKLPFWLRNPLLRLAGFAQRHEQPLIPREETSPPRPFFLRSPTERRDRPRPRLDVEEHETADGVVVRVRGQAAVAAAGALEASLMGLVARRPACVTFDLSELVFISDLAVGVLVSFRRAAVRAGARVRLAPNLRAAVRESLDRAELLTLFEIACGAEPCVGQGDSAGGREPRPNLHDLQRVYGLSWVQLVELEPQLEPLLWRARTAGVDCRTLTDVIRAFGPVRDELVGLIGFAGKHRSHPVLGSVGAYEVAYWKLYDAVAALLPGAAHQAPENR